MIATPHWLYESIGQCMYVCYMAFSPSKIITNTINRKISLILIGYISYIHLLNVSDTSTHWNKAPFYKRTALYLSSADSLLYMYFTLYGTKQHLIAIRFPHFHPLNLWVVDGAVHKRVHLLCWLVLCNIWPILHLYTLTRFCTENRFSNSYTYTPFGIKWNAPVWAI